MLQVLEFHSSLNVCLFALGVVVVESSIASVYVVVVVVHLASCVALLVTVIDGNLCLLLYCFLFCFCFSFPLYCR